jgi:hypothetical protein
MEAWRAVETTTTERTGVAPLIEADAMERGRVGRLLRKAWRDWSLSPAGKREE